MSSKEVDRYLDREGILEENAAIGVRASETDAAHREELKLKEELSLSREANLELQARIEALEQEGRDEAQGSEFMGLLTNLAEKQQAMESALQALSGRKFDMVLVEPEGSFRGNQLGRTS